MTILAKPRPGVTSSKIIVQTSSQGSPVSNSSCHILSPSANEWVGGLWLAWLILATMMYTVILPEPPTSCHGYGLYPGDGGSDGVRSRSPKTVWGGLGTATIRAERLTTVAGVVRFLCPPKPQDCRCAACLGTTFFPHDFGKKSGILQTHEHSIHNETISTITRCGRSCDDVADHTKRPRIPAHVPKTFESSTYSITRVAVYQEQPGQHGHMRPTRPTGGSPPGRVELFQQQQLLGTERGLCSDPVGSSLLLPAICLRVTDPFDRSSRKRPMHCHGQFPRGARDPGGCFWPPDGGSDALA